MSSIETLIDTVLPCIKRGYRLRTIVLGDEVYTKIVSADALCPRVSYGVCEVICGGPADCIVLIGDIPETGKPWSQALQYRKGGFSRGCLLPM